MIKTKLNLIALLVLISAVSTMAEPVSTNYTAEPEPVHGWQDLENNTEYPSLAQDLRSNGYVSVTFAIDAVGNVSNIKVSRSGGALFDQSAIDAVKNTDWNPAMQNGIATPVVYELPFEFYAK